MIIAGTGHRPKWLPCKYDEQHPWLINLKKKLVSALTQADPSVIISGMALGWDTWLAEAGLRLGIPIWAYIPFQEQGENWPIESKKRYKDILYYANKKIVFADEYHKNCFKLRDEGMVNDCDVVYALYNSSYGNSGTGMTVRYAEKLGRKVVNFYEGI